MEYARDGAPRRAFAAPSGRRPRPRKISSRSRAQHRIARLSDPSDVSLADLASGEVVLHLQRARALDAGARLEVGLRRLRILGLHSDPEPGGREPARFQVGILVSVLEERALVDL